MEPSGLKANNSLPTDIRAVIFDMDGLLLDSEPLYRIAWRKAASHYGFEIDDQLYGRLIGHTDVEGELMLAQLVGIRYPREEFSRLRAESEEELFSSQIVPLKAGAIELLSCLKAAGISGCVATSTIRRKAVPLLERTGLLSRFEAVVCGDEVAKGKPAPDIFLESARRLNVEAGNCLVLEDSEAGVTAAHLAGIASIMVPDLKQPSPEIASLAAAVAKSLFDVKWMLVNSLVKFKP